MPDPKKKPNSTTSKRKKIKSDKSGVAKTKAKPYTVKTSKTTKAMEKDGRMQAARSEAFKKDVKLAGGMDAYLKQARKTKRSATPARKAY